MEGRTYQGHDLGTEIPYLLVPGSVHSNKLPKRRFAYRDRH